MTRKPLTSGAVSLPWTRSPQDGQTSSCWPELIKKRGGGLSVENRVDSTFFARGARTSLLLPRSPASGCRSPSLHRVTPNLSLPISVTLFGG